MIERVLPLALLGIHDDEFLGAALEVVAIPEALIVSKPVRRDLRLVHGRPLPIGRPRALVALLQLCGGRHIAGRLIRLGLQSKEQKQRPDCSY